VKNEIAEDDKARKKAVKPDKSFIVRAPAGSGKTDLLIARYLKLLSLADSPEEIVAVTFTNKATNEMRRKILNNLDNARSKKNPENKHAKYMISLANRVLKRDKEKNWHLNDSPDRLRIQTIDGLCSFLTRRMPILASFGTQPDVTDDARPLYEIAIDETLNSLDKDKKLFHSVHKIILHNENDIQKLKKSVINMLETRDLWLDQVCKKFTKKEMEQELKDRIKKELKSVAEIFSEECKEEVIKLLGVSRFPDCDIENLSVWHDISGKLLTKSGTWRKSSIVKSLIEKLEHSDLPRKRLQKILDLPNSAEFLVEGWDLIDPAKDLLKRTTAQLDATFAQRNLIDFTGISQHAVRALGDDDCPTDIALSLDYQIKHLLVDEVQDVSESQYQLLHRLTREWSVGDGRTLFLVGDPQQAIYGFRGAKVKFFLKIFNEKNLGNITLEPLTLKKNFRSNPCLVNWVNEKFAQIFPEESQSEGAVSFSDSVAANLESENSYLHAHCVYGDVDAEEAERIIEIIKKIKKFEPKKKETIAILVRNRSHITKILPILKRNKIPFNAVDIFKLSGQPVTHDLLALTRAFLFHADRIAWLACLRAPWCGLTIESLSILCEENKKDTIWQCIFNNQLVSELEKDEKNRLENFKLNMQAAMEQHSTPTRDIIEKLWYRLGGPAILKDENEFEYAKEYFSLLDEVSKGGIIDDFQELKRRIDELNVSDVSDEPNPVEIMTMHKAKGLEFDHVILPGLNRRPGGLSESPLLATFSDCEAVFVKPKLGEEKQSIYNFIRAFNKRAERNEERRMLYVATTRAIRTIHFIAGNLCKLEPYKGSSLSYLWPGIENDFEKQIKEDKDPAKDNEMPDQKTRRLPDNWSLPEDIQVKSLWSPPIENITEDDHEFTEFKWAGEAIKIVGIVVHRTLQQMAEDGMESWTVERLKSEEHSFIKLLHQYGVPLDEREKAINYIFDALTNMLNDERGQWILSNDHDGQRNEFPVSGVVNNRLIKRVIDRTFLDKDRTRWIIDYKTSPHEGTDLDNFLNNQKEKYKLQLEEYAALMEGFGDKNIKLGLYFPLLKGWREWEYKH
jgi:ATP-dependent exoDNAse (exonuclease V) beta subunit